MFCHHDFNKGVKQVSGVLQSQHCYATMVFCHHDFTKGGKQVSGESQSQHCHATMMFCHHDFTKGVKQVSGVSQSQHCYATMVFCHHDFTKGVQQICGGSWLQRCYATIMLCDHGVTKGVKQRVVTSDVTKWLQWCYERGQPAGQVLSYLLQDFEANAFACHWCVRPRYVPQNQGPYCFVSELLVGLCQAYANLKAGSHVWC